MRNLAKNAGITPTTIYYYFKNKEDLLDQVKLYAISDLDAYLNLKIEGTNFLRPYQAPKLKFHPVSKDVNKPANNNKQLIEAIKN